MKCPNCSETLLLSERHEIAIDYCPACRGVWLDKGELEKMLDYASRNSLSANTEWRPYSEREKFDPSNRKYQYGQGKPYKKRSFLGDLFDFD